MSGCPELTVLRAFRRGELDSTRAQEVRAHLETCRSCRDEDRAFAPTGRPGILASASRRLALAGAAAAVVLLALAALPPVRSAADGLLNGFRVQHFAVVKVDPSLLRNLPEPQELGSFSGTAPRVSKVATIAEAERTAGFKVRTPARLPAGFSGPTEIQVSTATQATYTFDEARLRTYLATLGAGTLRLPPADQLKVTIGVPQGVALTYAGSNGHVALLQGHSPTVEVPAALDVAGLREQLLAQLPAELASQLRSIPEWQSTAVLPAPKDAVTRSVTVDGAEGTLITQGNSSVLLWQRDGMLYAVAGNVPEASLLEVANSLVGH